MIRQLYKIEDWLFYRSRTCTPVLRSLAESGSRTVGLFADRLRAANQHGRAT